VVIDLCDWNHDAAIGYLQAFISFPAVIAVALLLFRKAICDFISRLHRVEFGGGSFQAQQETPILRPSEMPAPRLDGTAEARYWRFMFLDAFFISGTKDMLAFIQSNQPLKNFLIIQNEFLARGATTPQIHAMLGALTAAEVVRHSPEDGTYSLTDLGYSYLAWRKNGI
jgi:hypothetical protein